MTSVGGTNGTNFMYLNNFRTVGSFTLLSFSIFSMEYFPKDSEQNETNK